MKQVYENAQAPIGAIIGGDFLKEMIERKFFPVESVLIDGDLIEPEALNFEDINDDEHYVVAINTNCHEVMFVQLFTTRKVCIHTGMKAS